MRCYNESELVFVRTRENVCRSEPFENVCLFTIACTISQEPHASLIIRV